MRRAGLATVGVAVAVVLQLAVLDRLPFPGGSPPDAVLVLVVALALASGPLPGLVAGFGAGLALDIAPPGGHLLGQTALVFCLVGYGCGRMRGPLERTSWLPLGAVALGAAAGESLQALVGLTFGDPNVTWPAIRQALPPSVVYDLLLSPFVLYAVVRAGGFSGWPARAPSRAGALAGRESAGLAAGLPGGLTSANGAVRDTRTGRSPRLRAGAARPGDGWIGNRPGQPEHGPGGWVERRRQLRVRGGVAGSAAAGGPRQPARPAAVPHLRFSAPRRHDGVVGGTARGRGATPGRRGLPSRHPRLRAKALRSGPGSARTGVTPRGSRARLRGRAFRGGPSALPAPGAQARSPSRRLRLRVRGGRRGDGAVGGSVLGAARWAPGSGGTASRSAFLARRRPGAVGPLRSGRGLGAAPRFRSGGHGLSRWAPFRWAGDGLGGRRGGLGNGRGVLGGGPGGRGRWGRSGLPGGSRWLRGGRNGYRSPAGRARRSLAWWARSRRTGGLP